MRVVFRTFHTTTAPIGRADQDGAVQKRVALHAIETGPEPVGHNEHRRQRQRVLLRGERRDEQQQDQDDLARCRSPCSRV